MGEGTTSKSNEGFVELKDGPTVPVAAYLLAIRLEQEGFRMSQITGFDGPRLKVTAADGGKADLSPELREAITTWKHHLLMLLNYVPKSVA